jgi:hypothetical protein
MTVKRIGQFGLALAVSCAVFASSAAATTAPGVLNHVRILLSNSAIKIPRDQFTTAGGQTRYPRGAVIEFTLVNEGSTPISVRIEALAKVKYVVGKKVLSPTASAGKPIAPGATRHWKLGFYIRGDYEMDSLIHGKVAVRKSIIVF